MPVLEVSINSKLYQIGCQEDDKEKVIQLANMLNDRIDQYKKEDPSFFISLTDEKVFLYISLMILDENKNLKQNSNQNKTQQTKPESFKLLKSKIDDIYSHINNPNN